MPNKKKTVIVCGLSGAGTSTALKAFEDCGYYTIGKLPVSLLDNFLNTTDSDNPRYQYIAILPDIKSEKSMQEFFEFTSQRKNSDFFLLFLDAKTETLLKRYSESRRPHPVFSPTTDKTLQEAIIRERGFTINFKERANLIIDTSDITVHDLRRTIREYAEHIEQISDTFRINFVSFGFKYGAPIGCDLMVDIRFLPNPYFIEELKELTGENPEILNWVMEKEDAKLFLTNYLSLLQFLIPRYSYEGKSYLNIGIGCTGGRHRSVVMANQLSKQLNCQNTTVSVQHRDINQ